MSFSLKLNLYGIFAGDSHGGGPKFKQLMMLGYGLSACNQNFKLCLVSENFDENSKKIK